jgi:hypothetical protein
MKNYINLSLLAIILFTFACKDEKNTPTPTPTPTPEVEKLGTVEFVFKPMWGEGNFALNTEYTTPSGDKLTASDFKFFVSNIGFAKSDASENPSKAIAGDSAQVGVYLVDFTQASADGSVKIKMQAKESDYSDIRFDIGVPRQYNQADITKNPYPVNKNRGMYWSWNSGYKFLVINGTSKSVNAPSTAAGVNTHLSIGLDARIMPYKFRGLLTSAQLPQISVKDGKTTTVTFTYNVRALFQNGDGSNYRFEAPFTANTPNPVQVHGGYYSDVLKANAAAALEMNSFSAPQ